MRLYASALLLALSLSTCFACVATNVERALTVPGIPNEVDPSLSLATPNGGVGHACPVDGQVVTAAHVVIDKQAGRVVNVSYSYKGTEGLGEVVAVSPFKDLALLVVSGPIDYLPRAEAKVGDVVFWFEYDFRTRENLLRGRRRFATVIRLVAGTILFDAPPTPGASGTCLINSEGAVVGIVVAGFETDDKLVSGVAVTLPPVVQ